MFICVADQVSSARRTEDGQTLQITTRARSYQPALGRRRSLRSFGESSEGRRDGGTDGGTEGQRREGGNLVSFHKRSQYCTLEDAHRSLGPIVTVHCSAGDSQDHLCAFNNFSKHCTRERCDRDNTYTKREQNAQPGVRTQPPVFLLPAASERTSVLGW